MKTAAAKVSLRRQLITCAVFCAIALVVILLFHRKSYDSAFLVGLPLEYQILLGIAFGAVYWAASQLGSRVIAKRKAAQHIAESYNRLDLRGWNPLWVAAAAGLGEELLFRGALQPLFGIWITSVLFVLVHIQAYRFNKLNKRVLLQSLSIFAISIALGYVAMFAGLVTAIIVHAALDAVALYVVRSMSRASAEAAA